MRRLVLKNQMFRELCEDYVLARTTLDTLQGAPAGAHAAERISDYVVFIAELEREVSEVLEDARSSRD